MCQVLIQVLKILRCMYDVHNTSDTGVGRPEKKTDLTT